MRGSHGTAWQTGGAAVPFLHGVSFGTVEASAVAALVKHSSGARVMPAPIWPTPARRCAIPVSTTLRASIPAGFPAKFIGRNGEAAESRRFGDGTFAKIGRRIGDRIAGEIQAVDDRCWCRKPAIPGAARLGAELNTVAGQRSLRQRTDGVTWQLY